jgi:nucleotide-binding universal stress UspA family protein
MPTIAERSCKSLKRILFGTDFSPVAERATSYARALALSFSAMVEIVHVFDADIFLDDDEPRLRTLSDRLANRAGRLQALTTAFSSSGIKTTTSLSCDCPAWTGLLKVAEADRADLIIAATRSKAQLKRVFAGSTVEKLIRHSARPVLTIGPHVESAADGPLSFRRIVYGTDFSPEAEKAADCALSFAAHDGARLYACHVMAPRTDHSKTAVSAEGDVREALERQISKSSLGAYGCELTIGEGDPANAILALAAEVNADLIVLGARRSSFWLTHVERGVSLEVLAQAHCPVLTIH